MKKYTLLSLVVLMLLASAFLPFKASATELIGQATLEYKTEPSFASSYSGSLLAKDSMNSEMYEAMKAFFVKVAKGETASAILTIPENELPKSLSWTESQLGVKIVENGAISDAAYNKLEEKLSEMFDLTRVMLSVLCDCPYEQFWYDKAKGVSFQYGMSATSTSIKITSLQFAFNVSKDYQGTDNMSLNVTKIKAAKSGIESAKFIVDEFKNHNDYDKLKGYAEKLCFHAEYDHDAVNNGKSYGDSWQIINVFDGLTDTKVVCEGYAKAFKYLCDMTDFDGDVKCYTVSGTMNGGTGAGAHMWNIVSINGKNYLVDVTNCDSGTIGNGMKLFMRGVSSSDGGRTYTLSVGRSNITYVYDESQRYLFGNGYLVLDNKDYGGCDHSATKTISAKSSTCTEQGWKEYKKCDECSTLFDKNGNVITSIPYQSLASHTPIQVKDEKYLLSKGNCARPSIYFESCKACKKALNDTFEGEKSDHDVVDVWFVENGYHFHRCSVCTYKEDEGKCSGGTATCTSQARCDVCKMPYGDFAAHKFGAWKNDSSTHWKECSCYQRTDIGQHSDKNSDGKCDSCSYSMPVTSEPPKEESTPSVESKPPVDESKPTVSVESKPPVDESKPTVSVESKPPVDESKPTVSVESKPPVDESKPAVPDESVKNSKDESITPPEASDESISESSNVSLSDESIPENSETESTPTITDESVADESETEISDEECSHLDESISASKPDTSYSVENIKSFDTKTIVTIAVSIAAAVAVATLIIIIVKKKK